MTENSYKKGESEKRKDDGSDVPILLSEIGSRISEISRKYGKKGFAVKANISESHLYRYLAGKSDPTASKIIAMAKAANVSPGWLLTGEGPMIDSYSKERSGNTSALMEHPKDYLFDEPYSNRPLREQLDSAQKAAVTDIANNQDAPPAIPMTVYARLVGPLANLVPDLEGQREAVLGRCIDLLRAATGDEVAEMLLFTEEDLTHVVEVAMASYRIACERRGV